MSELKYIYFELHQIKGKGETTPVIENENVLLIKPHTNSSGIWGFKNVTTRHGNELSESIVEQFWVDLDKFNDFKRYPIVREALNVINKKLY